MTANRQVSVSLHWLDEPFFNLKKRVGVVVSKELDQLRHDARGDHLETEKGEPLYKPKAQKGKLGEPSPSSRVPRAQPFGLLHLLDGRVTLDAQQLAEVGRALEMPGRVIRHDTLHDPRQLLGRRQERRRGDQMSQTIPFSARARLGL